MRALKLLCLLAVPLSLSAQARIIQHDKARMYLDEDIIVEGPVMRVDHGPGGALWFSLGKAHPNATVVIVVPANYTQNFSDPRAYEGAKIQASGRLTTGEARGIGNDPTMGPQLTGQKPKNPYIVVIDPSRLKVIEWPSPAAKKP